MQISAIIVQGEVAVVTGLWNSLLGSCARSNREGPVQLHWTWERWYSTVDVEHAITGRVEERQAPPPEPRL
jgi:hypothetical protein